MDRDPDARKGHAITWPLRTYSFYETVTVMLTGAGFVTVPVPVGVTVTVYIRATFDGVEDEELPPQDARKPTSEIAAAVSSITSTHFRRSVNGAPSSTAPNTTSPPLCHGIDGA
jgi:hypothetical protein